MPINIGLEMAETAHLSAEEMGAFHRLQMAYWQHGRLPDDDVRLMRIAGLDAERWTDVRQAIRPLFGDGWHHARLFEERKRAEETHAKKVGAGKRGAQARWGSDGKRNADANGKSNGDAIAPANGSANSNKHLPSSTTYKDESPTRTHTPAQTQAREEIPPFFTREDATDWFKEQGGIFPADWDRLADLAMKRPLTWEDIP
jgi:uncharacterized protein YdaU (DUF1376 family)